jgi:hypothetical protein
MKMRQVGRLAFGAVLAVCLLLVPAWPAFAAVILTTATPSVPSSVTAPLAQGTTSVQIGHDAESNTTNVLVDVILDPAVKLPARVRIPVAPGATILWAGEILGGNASDDPERPFVVHAGKGGQYAELTLTQSHMGQLDTGGLPVTLSGPTVTSKVDFVQSVQSSITALSVRVPANVSQLSISPQPEGEPQSNSAGERLYTLASQALPPGGRVAIVVSYTAAPIQPTPAQASSNQTPIIIVLCLVLAAVVAALALVLRRAARISGGSAEEDSPDVLDDTETAEDTDEGDAGDASDEAEPDVGEEVPEDSDPFSDDDAFGPSE